MVLREALHIPASLVTIYSRGVGHFLTPLLLFFLIGLIPIGGILMVQTLNRRKFDSDRQSFMLNFPSNMDASKVLAWLRAAPRALRRSKLNLTASQSMAFETFATDQGLRHRLIVPTSKVDDIIPQLRALVPGVTATPEESPLNVDWTMAVEVGETSKSRSLSIANTTDTATSLLASLQPLNPGESILMQWVISPAGMVPLPQQNSKSIESKWGRLTGDANSDEIKERRDKLSEPNFMCVLRVAAKAATPGRAVNLIDRVRTKLVAVSSPHNSWYKVFGTSKGAIARVNGAASMPTWPAQLNAPELCALIAWPFGSPHVSGLPRGASRQLPANLAVPSKGIVIGASTFPDNPRPVALSYEGGLRHFYCIGGTGVGKTTLLASMAEQDMLVGHTVIVMEAKGDLFYETLARVPKSRIEDVIVVDVQDRGYPVGYNILQTGGDSRIAAGNIKDLFLSHFPDLNRTVWARSMLHRGLETLATDKTTAFTDIIPLLSPQSRPTNERAWHDKLTSNLTDYELRHFWERHKAQSEKDQEMQARPLLDRAWIITETPEVRNIFGQATSSFTFKDVLAGNKILLINLSGIASDSAQLTGTIFMQELWSAVQAAGESRKSGNKPAYLYMDEFQSFMKLPISTEEMLAKARSFGLGMRLAHQHLDQLASMPEVRSAVINNARSKVAFQLGSDDATRLAKEFGSLLTPHDLQNLREYEAYARVMTSEGASQPFSMATYPPSPRTANVEAIINRSRIKYGRPVEQVIQDMRTRRSAVQEAAPRTRQRPTISGEGF